MPASPLLACGPQPAVVAAVHGGAEGSRLALSKLRPPVRGPLDTTTEEETPMSNRTVLHMWMSVDGFIAGPNAGPGNGLGDGGERLHAAGFDGKDLEVFLATGALVAGRGTAEPAGFWGGDHHDGVPIFIVSRTERTSEFPLVTYVPDVATAMARAKEAAGERDVLVHGARIAQLALAAGVLDVLELHVVPVLLGEGRRLFEDLGRDHIELERVRAAEGVDGVTHMRYRVRGSG
jgi:dihydrofolate reductase